MKKILLFSLIILGIISEVYSQKPVKVAGGSKNTLVKVELSGLVLNEKNKPLKADILLEDSKGKEVKIITNDSTTGQFFISINLQKGTVYTISFINDTSFVDSKKFVIDTFESKNFKLNNFKIILPQLSVNRKFILNALNFYNERGLFVYDTTFGPVQESYSSVHALAKLMQKNKKLRIRIEGHYAATAWGTDEGLTGESSRNKALLVYNILVSKGIEPKRMTKIGFGSLYPLYPKPKSSAEKLANMRVEIRIVALK